MAKLRYVVKGNSCNCHPETCCCDDYQIYDTVDKKKYLTMHNSDIADDVCAKLNRAESIEQETLTP